MFGARRKIDLLRTPQCRCGQILIDAGLKYHLVVGKMLLGLPQGLIQPAQRRTAIAGNVAGGIQPRQGVALVLQQQQSGPRPGCR